MIRIQTYKLHCTVYCTIFPSLNINNVGHQQNMEKKLFSTRKLTRMYIFPIPFIYFPGNTLDKVHSFDLYDVGRFLHSFINSKKVTTYYIKNQLTEVGTEYRGEYLSEFVDIPSGKSFPFLLVLGRVS
jgi:hypothetical protein